MKKREILISAESNEIQVAIVDEGRLEEFYIERTEGYRMFGNIYKGVVKTVIPGIGACFVDLGTKKDGFLYVADALQSPLDLEEAEFDEAEKSDAQNKKEDRAVPPGAKSLGADAAKLPETKEKENKGRGRTQYKRGRRGGRYRKDGNGRRSSNKHKRIEDVVKIGQEVIVQIVKEPIMSKGPRLTTHFSIPARYLVMMPGDEKIGISRRIGDRKERDRIREILRDMEVPKGVGYIVRTAGVGKGEKEYVRDAKYLTRMWKKIHNKISDKKAPQLIHSELNLIERVIRDHLVEETDRIVVEGGEVHKKVKRFLGVYLPGVRVDVQTHKGKVGLFEKYKVEKEIERTYQRNVYLKSGGHIVIEQTESLVSIDVNTGKFTGSRNLEDTVTRTNLEAAKEIARQLRLRDIGGIIVIDFIDMERHENRRNVLRAFKEAVSVDRAKTNILAISELGLVEMTRQRIRPSIESSIYKTCPYCDGKGMVRSATTMAIQSVREIKKSLGHSSGRTINAYVHPEVSERILKDEKRAISSLEKASKSRIFIYPDSTLHMEDVNITFVK